MSLSVKEELLISISVSVASGCKPCTDFYVKKAREMKICDKEIEEAISDAMCVRDSAKAIMSAHGLQHLGIIQDINGDCCSDNPTRVKDLVSVAAAYAVNCTSNLEKHIDLARQEGISDNEILSVFDITLPIKSKASSHVRRIIERIENEHSSEEDSSYSNNCGCGDEAESVTNECGEMSVEKKSEVEKDDNNCCC